MNLRHDIARCRAVLENGGLILYPTDTVWGIGCDARDPDAVQKIFDLKKRTESKTLITLIADESWIAEFSAANGLPRELSVVKKPLTLIYPGAKGLAPNLIAQDGSIAMRIPNDAFCMRLLKAFGTPIVSTSANLAGDNTPATFAAISQTIREGVDYIVAHRQLDETVAMPSSIARILQDGSFEKIRD